MDWGEKNDGGDDLDLSLSLPLKSTSQKSSLNFPLNLPTKQPLPSLVDIASQPSSVSRSNNALAINMNNPPVGVATELPPPPPLPPAVSSPDSSISSGSRRRRREREELEGGGDDESVTRKKLRLSKEQVTVLEDTFKHQATLNLNQKVSLARDLNLHTRQVEVWFQNRRARTKTKKNEIDCEFWKKQYEALVEEKRSLQQEVKEFKANYMMMKSATTINTCPQCNVKILSPATSSTPPVVTRDGDWLINQLKGPTGNEQK